MTFDTLRASIGVWLQQYWAVAARAQQATSSTSSQHRKRDLHTAQCLAPFLKALGYRGTDLQRAESVPHFQDGMDLADLRTALVNLGYVTHSQKFRPRDVDDRLMPCLFEVVGTGETMVLLGSDEGGGLRVFSQGRYQVLSSARLSMSGTCYFARPIDGRFSAVDRSAWSSRLMGRFKRYFSQLLVISGLSSVLSIAIPLFVMTIYDQVIAHRALDALPMLVVGILIVMSADLYLKTLRSRLLGTMAARIDYLIGTATFGKLMRLPLTLTDGPAVSSQVSRLREFQGIRDLFSGPAATAIIDFPFTLLSLAAVAFISGWLVLVPLVCCFVFAVVGFVGAKWLQGYESAQSVSNAQLFSHVTDTTLHHESIKREGAEAVWLHRFRLASADAATRVTQVNDRSAVIEAISQFLNSAAALAVLLAGTLMVLDGKITVGALIATMAMTWRILSPAQQLFQTLGRLGRLRSSIRTLDQMMRLVDEYDSSIPNLSRPPNLGRIVFNRVNLRYGKEGDPSLMNINLTIPQNGMVAFTGGNGAGKSSILHLVQGLYQPQSGAIMIDGVDIKQLSPRMLRRSIACAPQRIDLFYGTIAQNIRLGDPLACDDAVREAVREVGLLDAVQALPDQFNTRIGDGSTGMMSSSFLRQLTIARALVRKTPILLLDEPESMLDEMGSMAVQKMLERLRGSRTILLVSHRPSFIKLAGFAVYMRGGLIEFGGKPDGAVEKLLGIVPSGKAA